MAQPACERYFLGVDVGSVSLSYVLLNQHRQIVQSDYLFHHGNIFSLLTATLTDIDLSRISQVAYNHKSCDFFASGMSVNEQIAMIEGVRYQLKNTGSVFSIGGETFGLILFDEKNQYRKYISNSSCAAGTGAFLDQQAERLGLAGSAELSQLASAFEGVPPKIATRCAVFAKTDLIHCQQEGHSLAAISAGLCKGLAHNIVDTLVQGITLREPVVVIGGVSQNPIVMHYLSELIGHPTAIPEYAVMTGALGCALIAYGETLEPNRTAGFTVATLLKDQNHGKNYFFPPLSTSLSTFPDFSQHQHYLSHNVEVDLYRMSENKGTLPVYLGIDIGSTSTKAVVMTAAQSGIVVCGLYTRTRGQPIAATQTLLRVLRNIEKDYELQFEFWGVGTTGSGRKFVQKVISADLAIDEITAHARAAFALNPRVDTIIEIGGQDSKFTVMRNGQVTFSAMNYVCAAGTGSFIEEQAKRLGVSLSDYADQAIGTPSPLTSDRCTVFMERDLNHFLSQGYSKDELLAATLHSVRDNYLSKVAHLNKIGEVICFQGATAKNKALIAAFEQKLQRPIFVSKYCHLTGALGVCLLLAEKHLHATSFRGIEFYKESPKVSEEICELCNNHCRLKRIQLAGESIMWGFMCGRDENSTRRISANQSGFDLLSSRRRTFSPPPRTEAQSAGHITQTAGALIKEVALLEFDPSLNWLNVNLEHSLLSLRQRLFGSGQNEIQGEQEQKEITIGLPNTLYMLEFIPFWRLFFKQLGYSVIISSSTAASVEKGKEYAGADFCAPLINWHSHIQDLSGRADYLFLPHAIQGGETENPKFYCYYSNYAAALPQNLEVLQLENRCISPLIDFSKPVIYNVRQIYDCLPQDLKLVQTPGQIREAFIQAWHWFTDRKRALVEMFQAQVSQAEDVSVVFLGRPYIILDPAMNKNIPQKFNEFGVKTFFQDMLPATGINSGSPAKEFYDHNHWKYGADILQAAEFIAKTPKIYPVFMSAFKCSPDSFIISYFKELLDNQQKPYLVLQIDEHGSDGGYSTRVEAAIETFRTHYRQSTVVSHVQPRSRTLQSLRKHGTILIPNYDSLGCALMCAVFERAGYHTLLIEETPTTVISSLRLNDGQCLPVSSIVQGAVETIQKYGLRPEESTLFLVVDRLACNFPQYPLMMKKLLEQKGSGFEKVQVCAAELETGILPPEVVFEGYLAFLFGGLLRRIGCRLRPYETNPGQTDRLIEEARDRLYACIVEGGSKERTFKEIVTELRQVPLNGPVGTRPKVAILGDLYVRDNDTFNQQLIGTLESYGAEVVTAPFSFYLRLSRNVLNHSLWTEGQYLSSIKGQFLMKVLSTFEKRFYQMAKDVLAEDFPAVDDASLDHLKRYHLSLFHSGETATNLLKIFSLLNHYPDISLFVHVNPIFCCPGLVSESIFKAVEKDIEIPIVSIVYDGTTTNKNELLAPYLHYYLGPPGESNLTRQFDPKAAVPA